MSGADIVREIERETSAEVEQILAAADQRAAEVIETARSAVRARVEAASARAEPAIRAEAGRRVNGARLRLSERRVEVTLARTAAVQAAAADRLQAIAAGAEAERWAASLDRLTSEALELAGPGATVRIRRRDAGSIAGMVDALGGRLEMVDDAPAGVVGISADGRIEVDATIPPRLERARIRLAEIVAGHLGLDG